MAAGPVVDNLAQEFAGQSAIFIEYDVDHAPSSRYGHWWAAFDGSSAYLPMVMVDSGNQISTGPVNYYNVFKNMVSSSLARPPQAQVSAYWWRTGNKVSFSVNVKNLTGVTLAEYSNSAHVHAIVYEDAHVGDTNRYGRAAMETGISSLAPNSAATFYLESPDLAGVDWAKLHYIVLVDYQPGGYEAPFDMLQAAVALPMPPFSVVQDEIVYWVNPADITVPAQSLTLIGPINQTWTATSNVAWATPVPFSGSIGNGVEVSVSRIGLSAGWQQGLIQFHSSDGSSDQVIVMAYVGDYYRLMLPIIERY